MDEIVEFGAEMGLRIVANVPELIFNRHVARYFHGIGRRLIAVATLGRVRIPSSLRIIPTGQRPKPRRSDWIALGTGLVAWFAALAVVIWSLL